MLRSSHDLRRGRTAPAARRSGARPPPSAAAPAAGVEAPVEEVLAQVEANLDPGPDPGPAPSANTAAQTYPTLTAAAEELFAAAEAGRAPDGPAVVAAVRAVVAELGRGDALLTETVRRRAEAQSWPRRSTNVAVMAMRLGREIDYDERRTLAVGLCGLTHDLGMIEVPTEVLQARRLSPAQLEVLQQHPEAAARIVRSFGKAFEWVAKVVVQVHERYDGSGYPRGLEGEQIHEFARIIGLVDTYEAMAQPRADRQARVVYNALKEIIDQRNALFDRRLIKALINIVSIFPLGSLVKLNNGEVGRAVAASRLHPTRPTVDILIDARGRRLKSPRQIDLQEEPMLYIVDPAIEEGVLDGR